MLNLDGNGVGLNGWLAIRNALTKNATLVTVQYGSAICLRCFAPQSCILTVTPLILISKFNSLLLLYIFAPPLLNVHSPYSYPVKDFERIHKDLHDSKKIVLRKLAYDLRLILNPAPLPRNAPAEVELPSSLVPLAPVPQCVQFLSLLGRCCILFISYSGTYSLY